MDLLLGLDVGTTATKALLFDLCGHVVASASYQYGLITPHEGWVEQDPEDLWRGVVETTRAVARDLRPEDRVLALSQSSQGGTTIPVDADGCPTYNAISWMDQRAVIQADRLRDEWGDEFVRATTGWAPFSGLPLQHIAWLRDNRPDVFEASRYFLFVNDFIGYRLTGEFCMNPSDASITQLFNIAEVDWDDRLLTSAGIRRDQLSPVHESGHVVGHITRAASEATGLPTSVLVANGAHDQYCAAVGIGVYHPGRVMLSSGTAWVILAVPENIDIGLGTGMSMSCHAVPGRWGALRSLGGVGTSLEWFLDQVWEGGRSRTESRSVGRGGLYDEITEAVRRSPPGAEGLLFFPLSGGHSVQTGVTHGGFVGLSLSHSRDDMARAVLEGVAFELRWVLDEIQAGGLRVDELKMVGGAARSSVWPRIVADITGVPVALPSVTEAACLGAAALSGVGAGVFPSAEETFGYLTEQESRVDPANDLKPIYDGRFARYQRSFAALE
ncbi:MAG: hypothetical protein GX620_09700 [Chloroflexi bacterium]|nr:hypothetical protein [Chloroflexota bacterium]